MSASRVRGVVAMRIVGQFVSRLAAGDSWEFAAFGRDDEVILTASSTQQPPDVAALRAETRFQRFAGASLPHVNTASGLEPRRLLSVVFGAFGDRMAIVRVARGTHAKPFAVRDGAGIERFFRQHGAAICAAIFDVDADEGERVAARRAPPVAFTIDPSGALLSSVEDADDEPGSLRTHFLPTNGEVPSILRQVLGELLELYRAGAGPAQLVSVLPFALVRLAPMRSRLGPPALLVTVEWLRSRVSLEVTAAQFSISKRELQVLNAMLRGAAVAEIAAELSISESTVVFHLKRMLKKTLSKNRTELAARMLGWESAAVS